VCKRRQSCNSTNQEYVARQQRILQLQQVRHDVNANNARDGADAIGQAEDHTAVFAAQVHSGEADAIVGEAVNRDGKEDEKRADLRDMSRNTHAARKIIFERHSTEKQSEPTNDNRRTCSDCLGRKASRQRKKAGHVASTTLILRTRVVSQPRRIITSEI
jgi:hypothetical protein